MTSEIIFDARTGSRPQGSLRLLRISSGTSVADAADAVGMGHAWLRRVERGQRPLTAVMAARLTKVYAAVIKGHGDGASRPVDPEVTSC